MPTCPNARLPYVDSLIRETTYQLSTANRWQMYVAVDAGDRSAEVDQVSRSQAVPILRRTAWTSSSSSSNDRNNDDNDNDDLITILSSNEHGSPGYMRSLKSSNTSDVNKTLLSRPRPRPRIWVSRTWPRLYCLSSRCLETKTLASRTTSLVITLCAE